MAVLWMLLKAVEGLLSREEADREVCEEGLSKGVDRRLESVVLAVLSPVSAERWSAAL